MARHQHFIKLFKQTKLIKCNEFRIISIFNHVCQQMERKWIELLSKRRYLQFKRWFRKSAEDGIPLVSVSAVNCEYSTILHFKICNATGSKRDPLLAGPNVLRLAHFPVPSLCHLSPVPGPYPHSPHLLFQPANWLVCLPSSTSTFDLGPFWRSNTFRLLIS